MKKIVIFLIVILINIPCFAYDFSVESIFYNIINSNQVEVTYNTYRAPYGSYSGTIQIPETVNYNNEIYQVTSIGYEAFTYSWVDHVTIPNSVTVVGENAFFKCEYLESIVLSNSLKSIGKCAFSGCSSLKSIEIPNSVTAIGERAFEDCGELGSVMLSNNLEAIPDMLFWGRNNYLTTINIPPSVKTIGKHAFDNCALTSITIPEGVLTIDEGAFQRCNKLSNVFIPSTVTSIGDYAFASSEWSIELVVTNILSPFSIPDNVFNQVKTTAILQVPKGTKSQYQELSGWSKFFAELTETIVNYTLSITVSDNGSVSYDGNIIRGKTSSFEVEDGSNATITFTPDDGYQIKSVKVNNSDVTSSISNNSYTISSISGDTSVEVEFEAIPPTTYTLSIKATGNGSATYDDITIKNNTKTFTVNEGTSATIKFTPDDGNRIKFVKLNDEDVTSNVTTYKRLTISDIAQNKTLEVTFEETPQYTLDLIVSGNGVVKHKNLSYRNKTQQFIGPEGYSLTFQLEPDDGYRISSVKENDKDVTSSIVDNQYTVSNISENKTLKVTFEAIPPTTYTLSIKATGNGSASYDGTTIKNKTSTFTVTEGTSATITFTSDNGYRIKSVKVNSTDVTSSVSNSKYTISSISGDTTVEVEFEAIPPTTYTLSIKATGNGSATYDGTTIKNKTNTFTVTEGSSATITFTPDNGYRIKNVKVNSTDVTSSVSNSKYTISSISGDTSVEVEFEAIPPTTYTLSIKATGNGSATYDGTTIKNQTKSFTMTEGTNVTITFTPDNGYRIKSVKANNTDVTSKVSGSKYTISSISGDTSVEVEFEAIPPTTYTLSIKAAGKGSATYDGTTIKNKTNTFTVTKGASATITFTPDNGYRIKSVKINSTDVTSSVSNSKYTISSISGDTTVEVEFEAIPPTTYTMSIKATGNGSATYDGTTIKNNTNTFTLTEGSSATISFTPDNGYRIKNVKVNSKDVTSNVSNSKYTISSISGDTTVEVEFEAIPPTTYTLSVKATGNGSATYNGTTIKNKTNTFTVTEGTSVTVSFTPDNGYRIKSVKMNSTDVTSNVSNSKYTISSISGDTSVEVEFEAIPPTTYTLSITATGNGSASYDGTTIKNKTNTFTLTEGSSATITFTPDSGYRIKSVKVNSTDVTSKVSGNKYTISSISSNTTVEVVFEAIPPTAYTLSITATGNGSASYDGTTIKNKTNTFTLTEGSSATITFTPDSGCRIKSVKVNNSDVTSSVSNNSYIVSNISRNTDVEVEFEVIPSKTYTLSITATGNGSASYEGTVVKNNTSSFTVNEGANATITFTPDNSYRVKSVKVNDSDVTSMISNNVYTISNISSNTSVEVEFEAIPATAYTLSIKATGNGSVTYDGTSVRGKTSSFNVNGGTSATITFSADDGNRIKSVTVNSTDVTSKVMNNSYTISNISGNTAVEAVFEEIIAELTIDGIYYNVVSDAQQTVIVAGGDFGMTLDVPASFIAKDKEWKVVGVEADVLNNPELAAIIWNPEVAFSGNINNPNLLLYVKDKKYAPNDIQNVVVNGEADVIVLQDAEDGNNFYCPQEFTAKRVSYIHRYGMKTGFKTCQGWETIVLPFDVTTILSATGTEIVPYIVWQQGSSSRPFWLYSLNDNGWKAESGIKANTPYIISMPNNKEYDATYNLSGDIQFMSSNVQVLSSDNLSASRRGSKQLVPNYQNKVASQDIYALNVNSQWNTNTATETEGSAFIRSLRQVRPFEAYMSIEGGAGARRAIPIFDDDVTGIQTIPWSIDRSDDAIYNLNGQRVNTMTRGIYIQNGKKIFKR